MSTHLLDANVLIALAWPQHVHHSHAHAWFSSEGRRAWATCPLTELAFIRISSNPKIIADAVSPRDAMAMLVRIVAVPGHQHWNDDVIANDKSTLSGFSIFGHRPVTDAYLLALARHHKGKVATLDRGVAELIAEQPQRARYVTVIDA